MTAQPAGQAVARCAFGKTGVEVPILSLGGMFPIPRNQLMLEQAVKWGIHYWDTATSMRAATVKSASGCTLRKSPRCEKIFLVTKSAKRGSAERDKEFHESLKRLKTDYVDLFFVHAIHDGGEVESNAADWKQWAEKAKAAGKIKFFGFSTHDNMAECLTAAAKLGFIDGIMLKYDFRIMDQAPLKAAIEACVKAGIGLTAMKTQGSKSKAPADNAKLLPVIDQFVKKGFTDKQASLKAVWENPAIASICSQMPNLTILAANYSAAIDKTRLSAAERRAMMEYAAATCSSYCAGCSNVCESAVDGGLPVADVMRFLMYRHDYGMADHAREQFAALSPDVRQRLATTDYTAAEARCPQKIAIAEMMQSAATLLA